MSYDSFENLEVWKKSCQLAVSVYKQFIDCKDFSLRDQMNRAAISISSNIAEGAERGSPKDFIRFLHIAKGSAAELRTQLYISERIEIIDNKSRKIFCDDLKTISKMLQGLITSLNANDLPKT